MEKYLEMKFVTMETQEAVTQIAQVPIMGSLAHRDPQSLLQVAHAILDSCKTVLNVFQFVEMDM